PSTTMKYVCPAVTVAVKRDPRRGSVPSPLMPHPFVSSLQPTSAPFAQVPCRRYSTVSKVVAVALHVSMIAVPDVAGVHWITLSGAPLVLAHVPESVLSPLVVPEKVPPCAGMTYGLAHEPWGGVTVSV